MRDQCNLTEIGQGPMSKKLFQKYYYKEDFQKFLLTGRVLDYVIPYCLFHDHFLFILLSMKWMTNCLEQNLENILNLYLKNPARHLYSLMN